MWGSENKMDVWLFSFFMLLCCVCVRVASLLCHKLFSSRENEKLSNFFLCTYDNAGKKLKCQLKQNGTIEKSENQRWMKGERVCVWVCLRNLIRAIWALPFREFSIKKAIMHTRKKIFMFTYGHHRAEKKRRWEIGSGDSVSEALAFTHDENL